MSGGRPGRQTAASGDFAWLQTAAVPVAREGWLISKGDPDDVRRELWRERGGGSMARQVAVSLSDGSFNQAPKDMFWASALRTRVRLSLAGGLTLCSIGRLETLSLLLSRATDSN